MLNVSPGFENDLKYMSEAILLARKAAARGEVPVGAVIVHEGQIIGAGFNETETQQSPLAHAEMKAINEAARVRRNRRLTACDLYVSLEPCIMCVGAILQARIRRLVFGCLDAKAGAVQSLYELCDDARLNHRLPVVGGVLADESGALLRQFFADLRQRKKQSDTERWPSPAEGA